VDLREEIFSRTEKLWVLALGLEAQRKPLSPLVDLIDWYNNHWLTKNLISKQISASEGQKSLIAVSELLPVQKILIVGLGEEKDLKDVKTFLTLVHQTVEGLKEHSPWIVFSEAVPPSFVADFQKGCGRFDSLAKSKIVIG